VRRARGNVYWPCIDRCEGTLSVRFEADHGPPRRDVPDGPVAVCDDKSRNHGHVLAFRDPYPNGEGDQGVDDDRGGGRSASRYKTNTHRRG